MVTLKDVAAIAGVHFTVASSVLNAGRGNTRFSAQTRRAVESAARKLGYARDEAARTLRTGKGHAVGLVAGDIRNPFFAALATSLERQLAAQGYRLLLATCGADDPANEGAMIRALQARSVDAVFAWSEGRTRLQSAGYRKAGKPIVWLGLPYPDEWCVAIDIRRGLELAVDHLVACGKRRIGFFLPTAARRSGLPRPRSELLRTVIKKRGLPPPRVMPYDGDAWDIAAAVGGATEHLAAPREFDALIGYNDLAALGWLMAQRALPATEQVAVLGFDGTDWFRAWRPRAAYIDLQPHRIAEASVTLALEAIAAAHGPGVRTQARQIVCAPRLVER